MQFSYLNDLNLVDVSRSTKTQIQVSVMEAGLVVVVFVVVARDAQFASGKAARRARVVTRQKGAA